VSFSTLGLKLDEEWDWGNFYTYIKIREGSSKEIVQDKIPATMEKYAGQMVAAMASSGYRIEFHLQPIHDIHLQSRMWGELESNGDMRTVNFLQLIAIFVMVIAWINYINFAIAKSSEGWHLQSFRFFFQYSNKL
jgi:putative ABC transport system permease protein